MSAQAELDARYAADALVQLDLALAECAALNKGKKWRMCIPVDVDDSDVVIAGALVAARKEILDLRAHRCGLPSAAMLAPTDAMIDAAFRSLYGYVNASDVRTEAESRERASIAEALRAALAAAQDGPA